jgi:hypothetical protein
LASRQAGFCGRAGLTYARKLKAYADGSVAYANCEMQSLQ